MTTDIVDAAVTAVKQGGIIAYPTEAVYGLGCDPDNEAAVIKLLALKKRDVSKGVLLIAASLAQLADYLAPVAADRIHTVLASWPGPFTWVFPATSRAPYWIRGNHNTIGVRVSAHPIVRDLCQRLGHALVSTSANIQQQAPAMTREDVQRIFPIGIDVIVPGALGGEAKPTQIRDVVSGEVLRQ
jgi:L-threonylcarbamoyladenylate synthase